MSIAILQKNAMMLSLRGLTYGINARVDHMDQRQWVGEY